MNDEKDNKGWNKSIGMWLVVSSMKDVVKEQVKNGKRLKKLQMN